MSLRQESGHVVADSPADLENWTVLTREPWKPGVERWRCRQMRLDGVVDFIVVYVGVEEERGE